LTLAIGLALAILVLTLGLLVHGRLRTDVIALLVLGTLAVTGLVEPAEAVAGFSNAAVIAVLGMFILSAALTRAGIASWLGRMLLRVAGRREGWVATVVMAAAGTLSFFMNKTGVAALMLPVVVDLARRRRIAASRVLLPLSQGTVLGGLTTLVANPPNLLVSNSLVEAGFAPFGVFDFVPLGVPLFVSGIVFVVLIGRYVLPQTKVEEQTERRSQRALRMQYGLQARNVELRVGADCVLIGKTIAESRIGSAAGLVVMALERRGGVDLMPSKNTRLEAGDRLYVQGSLERIQEFRRWGQLVVEREAPVLKELLDEKLGLVEVTVAEGSPLIETGIDQAQFRRDYQANVLAIRRAGLIRRVNLGQFPLRAGDQLLVQARAETVAKLKRRPILGDVNEIDEREIKENYRLEERLFVVRVPRDSDLAGSEIARSRFGDVFDFRLLALFRGGKLAIMPEPSESIEGGDLLLIQGGAEDLGVLRGFQELEIEHERRATASALESERLGMIEATPDPRSTLVGRSIGDLRFRERYGLELAAIWRKGRPVRTNLERLKLQLGDALLFVGTRERLQMLGRDSEFVILTGLGQTYVDSGKAPIAGAIMVGVIVSVLIGWLPIHIAALTGATLMIVTGCLAVDEAYRAIDWPVIFVIAGLLPLGAALDHSGAAAYLAAPLLGVLEPLGPWWIIAGLYVVTAAANVVVPAPALVVLMTPIVLSTSSHLNIEPYTAMMAVAMAASASFVSPISHPAHLMVMGPGGYRPADFVKVGLPLAVLIFALVMSLLPVLWPLTPLSSGS
jgi:di/tricarboxylate transporter